MPASSSFAVKLDLLFGPPPVWPETITGRVMEAGRLAAEEGVLPPSPLIELFAKANRSLYPDILLMYERAYWTYAKTIVPSDYFRVTAQGAWVLIESLGVANGKGSIHLHARDVDDFFHGARRASVEPYERWAMDPHPVGGSTVLLRMESFWDDEDEREHKIAADEEGKLRIDPDTHPSGGHIILGDPSQETRQLGALCQLEHLVLSLLQQARPTDQDRAKAADRARKISATAGMSFMPSDGYCSCCQSDVTFALADVAPGHSITGCPLCGRTWCD